MEQIEFYEEYAICPDIDKITNAGKDAFSHFIDESKDKFVISYLDMESIVSIAD